MNMNVRTSLQVRGNQWERTGGLNSNNTSDFTPSSTTRGFGTDNVATGEPNHRHIHYLGHCLCN
jgi:hypothetical protein